MIALTATSARRNLFQVLKKSIKGHSPIRIASKAGNAVLVSEKDYEGLIETLEILSTPGMAKSIRRAKQDIKAGRTKSHEEVFGVLNQATIQAIRDAKEGRAIKVKGVSEFFKNELKLIEKGRNEYRRGKTARWRCVKRDYSKSGDER